MVPASGIYLLLRLRGLRPAAMSLRVTTLRPPWVPALNLLLLGFAGGPRRIHAIVVSSFYLLLRRARLRARAAVLDAGTLTVLLRGRRLVAICPPIGVVSAGLAVDFE
jgi:hypothetical protein